MAGIFAHLTSPQRLFVAFAPAIMVFALALSRTSLIVDGDPYWHIAAGSWMIDTGTVLKADPFSYTFAGQPWNAHEWLSELLMAIVYRTAGISGLYVLFGLVIALTSFLLASYLLKRLDPIPALIVLLLAVADIAAALTLRPHVFSLPILVLWSGEILTARHEGRAPSWLLFPLMILWVNLHASFLFGIALLFPFALESVWQEKKDKLKAAKAWTFVILGTLAAAFLNPQGISGLYFPIWFSIQPLAPQLTEWQSSTFGTVGPLEFSLLALIAFFAFFGAKFPPLRLLVLIGLIHMTLAHRRFVVIFGIVGALMLAETVAEVLQQRGWRWPQLELSPPSRRGAMVGALVLVLSITSVALSIPRTFTDDELTPVTALSKVPPKIASQPVFNEYSIGGYLILMGYRPFIDGRAELYGASFVENYGRLTWPVKSVFDETFAKYGIVWTILPPWHGTNVILDLIPDWCTLYADKHAIVHVKKSALADAKTSCVQT